MYTEPRAVRFPRTWDPLPVGSTDGDRGRLKRGSSGRPPSRRGRSAMEHQADGRTDSCARRGADFPAVAAALRAAPRRSAPLRRRPGRRSRPRPMPSGGIHWRRVAGRAHRRRGRRRARHPLRRRASCWRSSPTTTSGSDPIEALGRAVALDIKSILDRAQPSVVSISTGPGDARRAVRGRRHRRHHLRRRPRAHQRPRDQRRRDHRPSTCPTGGRRGRARRQLPDQRHRPHPLQSASGLTPASSGVGRARGRRRRWWPSATRSTSAAARRVTQGIVSALNRQISQRGHHARRPDPDRRGHQPRQLRRTARERGRRGRRHQHRGGRVQAATQNIGFAIAIDALKPLIEDLKAGEGTITRTPCSSASAPSTSPARRRPTSSSTYGVETEPARSCASVTGRLGGRGGRACERRRHRRRSTARRWPPPTRWARRCSSGRPGDEVEIVYERNGERLTATATLTTRAETDD